MGPETEIIVENSLRVTTDGYQVGIRFNWYRSIPLSCIKQVKIALDDDWVAAEKMRFIINDHEYELDELSNLYEELWFVQDSAILHVIEQGKVTSGESYLIEVEIIFRAPNISIGKGKYLDKSRTSKMIQVAR